MTPLLIVPIVLAAAACGSQINTWAGASPSDSTAIERRMFGLATGLVLLAYAILIEGLLGFLSAVPIVALCVLQAAIGALEYGKMAQEFANAVKDMKLNAVNGAVALVFILFGCVSLIGCFTPPTSVEYDALTYHLADPKIYLAHHRIIYLPWESHSNFAFTMEMLYTLGLSVHSVPLAKLFHFLMGLTAVTGTYFIGRRIHSSAVGAVGALIFVSMPLVFWEAGTAYVDLAASAFGALGMSALLAALDRDVADRSWLRVSMIMMACMVSVKATSLVPMFLMSAGICAVLYSKRKQAMPAILSGGAYCAGSLLLGSVWYVKSWIVTGNPFFPFAYSIFGGRHWSTSNAQVYAQSQSAFGMGHSVQNLVVSPWNLLLYTLPWNVPPYGSGHPFNDFATVFVSLSPMLLATLFLPAFWLQTISGKVGALGIFGLVSFFIWFALTQQIRYILPVMPIYCPLAAVVMVELWVSKTVAKYLLATLFVGSIGCSLFLAKLLADQELPVVVGSISQTDYITEGFPQYRAFEWINSSTAPDAGVIVYGEPEDFYLNRNHMWGEPGHGIVIPYDSMSSPSDLKRWMSTHRFKYILINSINAHIAPGKGLNGLVYSLTFGSGNAPVFEDRALTVWQIV